MPNENEMMCPVCGFFMDEAPERNNICPSCGTEFGLHDRNASVTDLRRAWMMGGMAWWSSVDEEPAGWNPFEQVSRVIRPTFDVKIVTASGIVVSPYSTTTDYQSLQLSYTPPEE